MLLTRMFDVSSRGDTGWILVWKGTEPAGELGHGRHDLVDASATGVLHKTY